MKPEKFLLLAALIVLALVIAGAVLDNRHQLHLRQIDSQQAREIRTLQGELDLLRADLRSAQWEYSLKATEAGQAQAELHALKRGSGFKAP